MSKITNFTPLVKLRRILKEQLGEVWKDFEVETILLSVENTPSQALYDKLSVLKVLEHQPELFYQNVLFFASAVPAINGFAANTDIFVIPSSLEVAYALKEVAKLLNTEEHKVPSFDEGVKRVIQEALINDGFSKVIPPFDVVGGLDLGEVEEVHVPDMAKKEKAIEEYLNGMES